MALPVVRASTSELRSNPQIDKLPPPMQRSLFRIVQEALANVYRHASASQVSIQFRWIGDRLHMVITDNGHSVKDGLEHRRRRFHPGVGMRGIRARLDEFAGELRIIRVKPNGTRLHAAIPVCEVARKAWASGALQNHDRCVLAARLVSDGNECPHEGSLFLPELISSFPPMVQPFTGPNHDNNGRSTRHKNPRCGAYAKLTAGKVRQLHGKIETGRRSGLTNVYWITTVEYC